MTSPRLSLGEVSPSTSRHGRSVGQYEGPSPVHVVAEALGKPISVAAQLLKFSDPRCPVAQLAVIVAALNAKGRADYVARLLLPLDIARKHVKPLPESEIIPDADHLDISEDLLENQYRAHQCIETRRRWLKGLKEAHAKEAELIATLEAECQA